MRKLIIAILVVFCLSWGGEGEAFTGNYLLEKCEKEKPDNAVEAVDAGICFGFIIGANQAFRSISATYPQNDFIKYCVSGDVVAGQVEKVVIKYLKQHPEKLHLSAVNLILFALQEAFPCPKEKEK